MTRESSAPPSAGSSPEAGPGLAHGERARVTVEADARARGAWRVWLASLASDATAATAAAHLYGELPPEARDAWLDALADDAPGLEVPDAALYGPLLAVEGDPARHERIRRAANTSLSSIANVKRALVGTASEALPAGVRIAVLVIPLYLEFVRVLVFRIVKDVGFDWVRQIPIIRDCDAPSRGSEIEGIHLYASSRDAIVDELAHAVLAHRRSGREIPELLRGCAELFNARDLASEAG